MTKSRYKLQSVMDVRERAKQEAAKVVALKRTLLSEAEEELARREKELELCRSQHREARDEMLREAERGSEARHVVANRAHIADLREREDTLRVAVDEQQIAVSRAERELDQALTLLAETSKELKVIDTHRQHWREDEQLAERRREQKASDEMAATLHDRRRN